MAKLKGSILIPQKGGIGARYLSSALQAAGQQSPNLYFINKTPAHSIYNETELAAIKKAIEKDDWIGISVTAIGLERTRQFISLIRTTPELATKPLLVGGVQAFATPNLFYEMGADAVCNQEAEIWLPEAIKILESGQNIPKGFETDTPKHNLIQSPDYDYSKGTHFALKNGFIKIITTAEEEFETIRNFSIRDARYPLWLFTERRCRFSCSYCINHKLRDFDKGHGGSPGRLSTPKLLDQVKEITSKHVILDYVVFFDDDFLLRFLDGRSVKKDELDLFCSTWKNEIKTPFFIYFSPMTFNESVLNALIAAGCEQVNFGYQSGCREALRHYHRPAISSEKIKHISGFTAKAVEQGWLKPPDVDFLINSPFETAEDMRQTIEMILSLHPPFDTQMHNLRLFPGYKLTRIFSDLRDAGRCKVLPGYKTILNREFQDHTPHSEWLWPNIEDGRAYYTILQMLMTGLCTEETLGILKRDDMQMWLNLSPEQRRARIEELKDLFRANPRIKYYDNLAQKSLSDF